MTLETAFVKLKIKDQELVNIFVNLFKNPRKINIIEKGSQQLPDLVIFELGKNLETDLDYIRSFLDQNENTDFFLISRIADQDILIKALRIGIKEFFTLPLDLDVINESLTRFQERFKKKQPITSRSGEVLSVVGSKGGVGTTTIATNLAVSIAGKQKKTSVALLDMNDLFGEIAIFLDLQPKHHWGYITKNIDRLDDFFLSNVLSEHKTGIKVLPSPRFLNREPPTPQVMEILLEKMKSNFDYVIIDIGHTINETALKILQISDLLLLVTIQTIPCLSNTSLLIKSFIDYGLIEKENISIVLNRYIPKGNVSREDAEEAMGKKVSWVIPNDYATTMSAINSGKPLYEIAPRSRIVKSFDDHAEFILPDKNKTATRKGWFF